MLDDWAFREAAYRVAWAAGKRTGTKGGTEEDMRATAARLARAYATKKGPATRREWASIVLYYGDIFLNGAHMTHPNRPPAEVELRDRW
jgi:hypothetical protein